MVSPEAATAEPAPSEASADTVAELPGGPAPEPIVASVVEPILEHPAAPTGQRICSACGAAVPAEDLFCGDCGTALSSPATETPPIVQAPVIPPTARPELHAYPSPATYEPRTGVEDYLSFRALWITSHAAALFWIAEGANLLYWILDWVVSNRWSGAQSFFGSAAGFVLFAVVIRIVTEAAVASSRAAKEGSLAELARRLRVGAAARAEPRTRPQLQTTGRTAVARVARP